MLSKQKISSKIAIVALLGLALFLGDLKFKQWQSQREIEKQAQSLVAQTDALQKKNDQLNQSLQYLNSTGAKEHVAREQLGYKKNGEVVYGFINVAPNTQDSQAAPKQDNVQKWWDYFFNEQ
ncbi:MAG TPA: septum formation initiator family protein [Candidatus Limnocylindria bacterium]|nr:septum formation initiator family protein [Candidatus Limnocylindria bacterium]